MNFRKGRIAAICAGAAVIVVGVAGCGGSDGSSSEALSKDDFIAQADAICAELDIASQESEDTFVSAYQEGDYETAANVLQENQDQTIAAFEEVRALTEPEEDRATIDSMFALVDQQVEIVPGFVDAVRAGDEQTLNQLGNESDAINDQVNEIADEYGFVDCGSAGDDA